MCVGAAGVRVVESIPSLVLIVQSNVADPVTVTNRILEFVDAIGPELLEPLPQKELDEFVTGLVRWWRCCCLHTSGC